ncbi:N-acetyl-1-D-myo-inositol-2-amino-2-deoxy-alpha-D-glucopyranoside deacetylase [Mycobacterium numidiamassiliense]|uniref:1D-myo-inositol 2-acetamido-2-deoxy-alpha-D-glucopyranoside deacetylase n=1 Tax=Mycobacterium numidiamassiliense TaxID=1841861 RepID=A0A2U3PC41_9MYCO|nr:N-acetyl-1-D-myo-inositol-2-amino-2-deoxy-alpha-D-glucopyranoside deacetylase [Mycobacterium numidiamassiliense]SPM41309.1 N-acetyl-1-D-myo-inositol-2-amino-2-deoxy-alpha-D-glucopyranoside deacetylase [Mycobacterium numidiamassiliense]
MPDTPRLLFVHAHPDDESLSNGATIAHYTARGAQVRVVTCTLGEEGEVIGDRWAELAFDRADQLGGYRIGELTAALQALGVGAPIYLGGAGRWRDSGMVGTAKRRRQRFIDADDREAVGALVAIIREQRPHVVVTYDPNGGYGHPDHIQTHRIATAAVAAAGGPDYRGYPGEPWQVPKFYWTVLAYSAFEAGWGALGPDDLLPGWQAPPEEEFNFAYSDDKIDAVVEADADARAAKTAALAAHATQVVVGPTGRACALSNNMALPIVADEHYVLVAGSPGERDERGWETDLLAGLGLAAAH